IRPAEMWPYDYSRENETPLLWFSEGFTNYYGALSVYRAGLMDEKAFLARVAGAASGVEGNEVRNYVSPANASVSTWVGYDTPVAFGISYYTQGQNLGALLDLSIRHDSGGKASLDDVLRTLYRENYQRGRGFTIDDMVAVIKQLTKQDYAEFFDRYIYGTEIPDFDRIFGYAGYRIEKTKHTTAVFGWAGRVRNGGFVINYIRPETPAAEAGLHVGDIVMSYNGVDVYRAEPDDLAGHDVKLKVKRGDQPVMDVTVKTGSRQFESYSLVAAQTPTAEQMAIRQGWLKR
ncbi:MAG: PDZ domain-containing protein, partial [Acidobacteriota bacterium]